MKRICLAILLTITSALFTSNYAQEVSPERSAKEIEADASAVAEYAKKAKEWVASLNLNDPAKEERVEKVIATHMMAVRNWNNEHPYTEVPAGINPLTGKPLSDLDRQVIANSAKPKSVHEELMNGLRKDLTTEQVNVILDKYTIGKVDFTMNGYRSIVPDLTEEEATTIRGYLEEAREQAVDYKSMKQISAIFEIYKTMSEQYLNSNGRNWHELYKAYVNEQKRKKEAEKKG